MEQGHGRRLETTPRKIIIMARRTEGPHGRDADEGQPPDCGLKEGGRQTPVAEDPSNELDQTGGARPRTESDSELLTEDDSYTHHASPTAVSEDSNVEEKDDRTPNNCIFEHGETTSGAGGEHG